MLPWSRTFPQGTPQQHPATKGMSSTCSPSPDAFIPDGFCCLPSGGRCLLSTSCSAPLAPVFLHPRVTAWPVRDPVG